ncbi:unannotated protein [freshwater metagenome]|uniref:Unannotated protein n=1 Tax=freshwater metagenome TaxID=449393 RepID=A0A6J7QTB4_9ZZZZ
METDPEIWMSPGITGSNGFWRGPYTSRHRFCTIVAAANVEMKAVISKSIPGRPSRGLTATK